MTRGNGKAAKDAIRSNALSAYVKPASQMKDASSGQEWVDWDEVAAHLLCGAIQAVNRLDGSILLGHTRDKASYSVLVFYGGDKNAWYFPCSPSGIDSLNAFLSGLIDAAAYGPEDALNA